MNQFFPRSTDGGSSTASPKPQAVSTSSWPEAPPAKRVKLEEHDQSDQASVNKISEDDADMSGFGLGDSQIFDSEDPIMSPGTAVESAAPPVKTDKEAVEEYEAMRASQTNALHESTSRLNSRKWVRGRSSIYVDAFNLALETVLEEESHLFDEREISVFSKWRELDYEAQYL
jgi:fanconi-associated nuclease 1